MFDFVRKHTKIMQFVLFLLIVPSFVLVGISGYNASQEKGPAVATVDGKEITQAEWDAAHRQEVERLRQQAPNLDVKLLDSPQARYATLERMVRDRVIGVAAQEFRLVASDQRLARELQQNQVIASLRGPDGKLDMARYRQVVGQQGMSPQMFEESVRADLSARQVLAGVAATSFATSAQAAPALDALLQRREIQVARFDSAAHVAGVNPTDAELEAYYKSNPAQFQAPEQATVEYVLLDLDSVMKGITINEADLKTYFEQNVAKVAGQEERRASHILIAAGKDAPGAERDQARTRAQELLAEVRKNPARFAELARQHSQDPGSAANGGDLGYFARGAMTKAFEDAVYAMKKGEISDLVETEFGFHIVSLVDVKTPKQRTYEEARPELEAEVRKQQAQRKFAEVADTFSNAVYEQADSLKPAAEKLGLEIRTATVGRTPAPGATGPLANPKLLAALFTPDSVQHKRNTEAVEVGPSTLAAGRIVKYEPARTMGFEEVKAKVRERVVAARAAELAKKEGSEKLAAWKADPASAYLSPAVVVSRQQAQQQPVAVVQAALSADPGALPAFVGVDLGEQGYAVVKVNRVIAREAPAPQVAEQEVEQFEQWVASAETLAYYNLLKDRFKAQILVPRPKEGTQE